MSVPLTTCKCLSVTIQIKATKKHFYALVFFSSFFGEKFVKFVHWQFRSLRLQWKGKYNNKGYFRPACPLACPVLCPLEFACPLVRAGLRNFGSRGGCWRWTWRETSANSFVVSDSIRERHSVDTTVQLSGRPPAQQGQTI